MNGPAYYNECDPFAAAWLRNLIAAGHIAPGVVDERSIVDVRPSDLVGFGQCHFFAGIGGWSLALRMASVSDGEPVWTGSCPCQPFSAAGKRGGFDDARHLWPAFYDLIRACRPPIVFGEQVVSATVVGGAKPLAGPAWLDVVFDDLEAAHYACGAADIPAAGVGAPHIRQRLWWVGVADAAGSRHGDAENAQADRGDPCSLSSGGQRQSGVREPERARAVGLLADSLGSGLEGRDARPLGDECEAAERGSAADMLANSYGRDARAEGLQRRREHGQQSQDGGAGFWSDIEWLPCRDGKARPTQPGLFPLLDGLPIQLERLRALEIRAWERIVTYGDANNTAPDKVLRAVRDVIRETPYQWSIGGSRSLLSPSLLFDFLFCVEATRDGAPIGSGVSQARSEARRRIVRGLRGDGQAGGPPCGCRPNEQCASQPSDAVLALSLVLARDAETYRQAVRQAHAASVRVGALRGAGNAISPPAGAAFVRAVMTSPTPSAPLQGAQV